MKKRIISTIMIMIMSLFMVLAFTACGGSSSSQDQENNTQVTEETVRAADPMTEEEMENDNSEGCLDSDEY